METNAADSSTQESLETANSSTATKALNKETNKRKETFIAEDNFILFICYCRQKYNPLYIFTLQEPFQNGVLAYTETRISNYLKYQLTTAKYSLFVSSRKDCSSSDHFRPL